MPQVFGVFIGLALGLASLYVVFRVFFRTREARPSGSRQRGGAAFGKRRTALRRPRMY
jgi:membrane protein implicated in regulation of membrane protease activity